MKTSQKCISIAASMAALTMADLRQADAAGLALQNATATFSQASDPTAALGVSTVIDGNTSGANGWAILPQVGQNQIAVFETQADIGFATGTLFTFTFQQLYNNPSFPASGSVQHMLGRFRLSFTTDDRSTFADGLESGGDVTANWVVLDPITFTSQNGATLTEQPDMSILASGFNPATDTYTVTTSTTFTGIKGIRLEVLADPSLPFNGPGRRPDNGNFVLTEMTVDIVAVPRLTMSRAGNAQLQVSWGTNFTGYVLEHTTGLPAATWTAATNNVLITGESFSVAIDANAEQQFFRLRKP